MLVWDRRLRELGGAISIRASVVDFAAEQAKPSGGLASKLKLIWPASEVRVAKMRFQRMVSRCVARPPWACSMFHGLGGRRPTGRRRLRLKRSFVCDPRSPGGSLFPAPRGSRCADEAAAVYLRSGRAERSCTRLEVAHPSPGVVWCCASSRGDGELERALRVCRPRIARFRARRSAESGTR